MANLYAPARERRRVQVEVGVVRSNAPAAREPNLLLIGLVDFERIPSSPAARALVLRSTVDPHGGIGVEVLRLTTSSQCSLLPGLAGAQPSGLRDAALGAFVAGLSELRVALIYARKLRPWDFERSDVIEALDALSTDFQGAAVLMPDFAGPPWVGVGEEEGSAERWERAGRVAARYAPLWTANFQVALLDAPSRPQSQAVLEPFLGADCVLCHFRGRPHRLRQLGWHSAAATLGGRLSRDDDPVRGTLGLRLPLGPRRQVRAPIWGLGFDQEPDFSPDSVDALERLAVLRIDDDADDALVLSEPSFRRPLGQWSLPALRTVKTLHRNILRAAESVLFRPVDAAHSLMLLTALNFVMRPFVDAGVLVGPSGAGAPDIDTDVVRDPMAPGLAGTIAAQLRPWCSEVRVRVELREGQEARVEVNV